MFSFAIKKTAHKGPFLFSELFRKVTSSLRVSRLRRVRLSLRPAGFAPAGAFAPVAETAPASFDRVFLGCLLLGGDFDALDFAEAENAVLAFTPIAAFFENLDALRALQNVPMFRQRSACAQALVYDTSSLLL